MRRESARRSRPIRRWIVFFAVLALYVLHNDWWLWDEPRRFLGLPAGLAYHVGYCVAASLLMAWAVRGAADAGDDE